jgi:hypothetical protein
MPSAVEWRRPVQPAVPQRASGAIVTVTSNLFPVFRDPVYLYSHFLSSKDGWADKVDWLADRLGTTSGWILDESGSVVYSLTSIPSLSRGPKIEGELIDPMRLWTLLLRKMSVVNPSTVLCNSIHGSFNIQSPDGQWADVRLVPSQGTKSRASLSVSPGPVFSSEIKTLLDLYLAKGSGAFGNAIRVRCSHHVERVYTVTRLHSDNASNTSMVIKNESMTVEKYFKIVRKLNLERPDVPLAIDSKGRFLPLELCYLAKSVCEGRSTALALDRVIQHEVFKELESFGLKIASQNCIQTRGRQLPQVSPRDPLAINREINTVVFCLGSDEETEMFMKSLCDESEKRKTGAKFNIRLGSHSIRLDTWESDLKEGLSQLGRKPDLIFVIMKDKVSDIIYNRMKCIFDLKLQVASQFIVTNKVHSDRYWTTLIDHISLKVGPWFPSVKASGTVMGGITTKSLGELCGCKLVACTLSFDNGMSVFLNRMRAETKRSDSDFAQVFYEILLSYFFACSSFPNRVIMYVGQPELTIVFKCIAGLLAGVNSAVSRINRELRTGINSKLGYGPEINPNWTFILCDPRSGVQIHTESKQCVVTSSGIVSSHGIQFIMKPAVPGAKHVKYTVVHDTNNFTIPEIENFTQQVTPPDGNVPLPLVHARKLLSRAHLYISEEKSLFVRPDPVDSRDLINQKLFDFDQEVFRYRAPYI